MQRKEYQKFEDIIAAVNGALSGHEMKDDDFVLRKVDYFSYKLSSHAQGTLNFVLGVILKKYKDGLSAPK